MIIVETCCTRSVKRLNILRLALCAWKEKYLLEDKGSRLMKGHTHEFVSKCISGSLSILGMERFEQGIEANVNHEIEFYHETCSKKNTCA
jgi:hypothetical protein